jgi:hypothetical protein
MAEAELKFGEIHAFGAAMLGLLGTGLLWLTWGDSAIARYAWIGIAGALVLAMWLLPESVARPARGACYGAGFLAGLLVMGLLLLAPGALAYSFSKTLVEAFPRWLQMITLLAWLVALAAASLLLYSRALRQLTHAWIHTQGPRWLRPFSPPERMSAWGAVALYINFVFIAMGCFAGFAFLLHGLTPPLFLPGTREVDHGSLADFLLWQLLDAIPGIKAPETILWTAPLTYERAGAGWLVLLFKVMVIVPVVSGVGHYLKDEEPRADPSSG